MKGTFCIACSIAIVGLAHARHRQPAVTAACMNHRQPGRQGLAVLMASAVVVL